MYRLTWQEYDLQDSDLKVVIHMLIINMYRLTWQEYDLQDSDFEGCYQMIPNPFELGDDLIPPEKDYFTAAYNRERENMYVNITKCS